jgi:D-alanyl-D-alanine carboxypeptidase
MKTPHIPRIWFFVILFVAIVAAHFVILRGVVKDPAPQPEPPPPPPVEKTQEQTAPPAIPPTVQQPAQKQPGGNDVQLMPCLTAAWQSAVHPEIAPPRPAYRYRKPSTNPLFGAPLDFSQASHSDLPRRFVPGLSKWSGTGIVVDMDTRKVLWEKDSHRAVPVASMVKMMTMLLVAEAMERDPELTLDRKITITQAVMKVKRTGVLWLAPGEVFTLRELLLGIAVKSANDAATQMGEVVDGSVEAFVRRMNARAAELNLKSMVFYNPCGLPDDSRGNSLSSAADMVLLGERLLEYPFLLELCSTLQGTLREGKTVFVNTNRLINPHYPGVDGLKTGFINQAGFCLTFSALRNGRRIIGCVTGFKTHQDRDRFCRRLIDWAYDPKSVSAAPGEAAAPHPVKSAPAKRKKPARAAAPKRK